MSSFDSIKDYPIILCGYPKSGTTLLLSLLDNHPQLTVFPEELKFFPKVFNRHRPQEILLRETGFNAFRYDKIVFPSGERNYSAIDFNLVESKIKQLCEEFSDYKDILTGSLGIWHELQANKTDKKKRWVEKTPFNEKFIHMYDKWFGKNVIYLHIIRDPRDNYTSYKKKHPNLTIDQFAKDWALSTSIGLYANNNVSNYHIIRYEDLVREPEKQFKRICGILDIDFHTTLLIPNRNGKSWSGNSMFGTKFKGISSGTVGRFLSILHEDEIKLIESSLFKFFQLLKYPFSSSVRRCNANFLFRLDFIKWKILYKYRILYDTLSNPMRSLSHYKTSL